MIRSCKQRPAQVRCPLLAAGSLFILSAPAIGQGYTQTNLVTDNQTFLTSAGYSAAAFTDSHLVNPWGISYSPTGAFWVSDQGTDVSTLYSTSGSVVPLVVATPVNPGGPAGPTGQVFNNTGGFNSSLFIFAGLDGSISYWSSGTTATVGAKTTDAVYTGLALANNGQGNFLYAANAAGGIDVFDSTFRKTTLSGTFTDPNLAAGLTPYNVQSVGGLIYVTYATARGTTPGGAVDAFDTNGNLVRRLSGGTFADPWGLALAPASFGQFGGDLLVGNFGSGQINGYSPTTGQFVGTLTGTNGSPLVEDGLWGLTFGNGGQGGDANKLYFAAGIGGETHGLFGSIAAAPEPSQYVTLALGGLAVTILARRRRKA